MQSLMSQTFKNFEYLVIDEISTDDSLEVIKKKQDNNTFLGATEP
jgi:glycosyltransferase involved in cell wall biosynthesis